MAYRYKSTSFIVPAGYKDDLGIFVKQVESWISSNFPELTFVKNASGSGYYYSYFYLGDTGIQLQIGIFSSGSLFFCSCEDNKVWGSSYGASITEGSTVGLQLMVVQNASMFSVLKSSDSEIYYNSSALAVKEIISGNSYVLCSLPGQKQDSSAKKAHFWFPSSYYYRDKSNKTVDTNVSVFPSGISSLAGVISKQENDGSRAVVISPVIYMKSGPLSLLTAAEDAVKLMYANDGGMPTVTNQIPIQVGSDQYIALENPNYSTVIEFAYLKVN